MRTNRVTRPQLSQSQAQAKLDAIVRPLNLESGERRAPAKFSEFVTDVYFRFGRKRWKESTAMTTEQRIQTHLVSELGALELRAVRREPNNTGVAHDKIRSPNQANGHDKAQQRSTVRTD